MINTLRPVTFEWKSNEKNSGVHRGFIAQEVTSSDAYWVREDSVYSGSADYQYLEGTTSIDEVDDTARTGLVSKLTEKDTMYVSAIQELTQAVRDLRAMITGSTDLNQLKYTQHPFSCFPFPLLPRHINKSFYFLYLIFLLLFCIFYHHSYLHYFYFLMHINEFNNIFLCHLWN